MAKISVAPGSTSVLVRIFIQDSSSTTGAGLTGLTSGSSGLVCYRARDDDGNAGATQISLSGGTRGTWSSGGFVEKDATNMPGFYELGIPDAALATGSRTVDILLKGATNMAPCPIEIDLKAEVNVWAWKGTAVATPATAGVPSVDVVRINNVVTTSVTTINANVGQTQPVNFTGTGSSAYVKVDLVDIGGSANTGTAGYVGIDWGQIANKTTTNALTNTTVGTVTTVTNQLTAAQIATGVWQDTTSGDFTVSSSIGKSLYTGVAPGASAGLFIAGTNAATVVTTSFTTTFTGNLTGSVASVTGAVGSVTGNVGGNVTGSVGSVVAGVDLAAAGMDAVVVETGINARQSLSLIAAACVGEAAGFPASPVTYDAADNAGTTRISAVNDGLGNRSSVTLTPPA